MGMEVLRSVPRDPKHLSLLLNGSENRLCIPHRGAKEVACSGLVTFNSGAAASRERFQKGRVMSNDL